MRIESTTEYVELTKAYCPICDNVIVRCFANKNQCMFNCDNCRYVLHIHDDVCHEYVELNKNKTISHAFSKNDGCEIIAYGENENKLFKIRLCNPLSHEEFKQLVMLNTCVGDFWYNNRKFK